VKCFSQVINSVFVLVPTDVLDDVALQEPHVVRDDVIPGLDRLFNIVASTHLIVVGSHGSPQRPVETLNQSICCTVNDVCRLGTRKLRLV
jgi:hypothetical protein